MRLQNNRGSVLLATVALIGASSTSVAIVGTATKELIAEARENAAQKAAVVEVTNEPGTDVPELCVIPGLISIESNNSDEHYENAP